MKYNSIENAERFLKEQIEWCLINGYKNFSIWSNGKELVCALDNNDISWIILRGELKTKGYWRTFRMIEGKQVSVIF